MSSTLYRPGAVIEQYLRLVQVAGLNPILVIISVATGLERALSLYGLLTLYLLSGRFGERRTFPAAPTADVQLRL
jgi:hypothetical protein